MSTIVSRAATRVNAKYVKTFVDTNGYQGTSYHLFLKDGKFGLVGVSFGTCAHCDWHEGLASDWIHGDLENRSYSNVPNEVFEPIENYIVTSLDTWYTKEELMDNLHMIFGVGYSEENTQEEVVSFIKENY